MAELESLLLNRFSEVLSNPVATIYDIAKLAGVSPATVSNAFNRPDQMKSETRERILIAADELGYQPNVNAQALAGGKSQLVGLLIADIRMPYVANVTRGIEDRLAEEGFIAVVSSTDGDGEKTIDLMRRLKQRGVGGFILVPSLYGVPEKVRKEVGHHLQDGTNIIVAGHELQSDEIAHLAVRGQATARQLTDHLLSLGHRDIAFLTGFHSRGEAIWRWLGFQEAMMRSSIPIRPELVAELEGSPQASRLAVENLMAFPKPPTAIFAMNDIYARGVIDYVVANRVQIPEELSVVTFDYQVLAQRITPRLTSIVVPAYDVGSQAAELFLALQNDRSHQPRVIVLPHTFEDRGSTGPPKIVVSE